MKRPRGKRGGDKMIDSARARELWNWAWSIHQEAALGGRLDDADKAHDVLAVLDDYKGMQYALVTQARLHTEAVRRAEEAEAKAEAMPISTKKARLGQIPTGGMALFGAGSFIVALLVGADLLGAAVISAGLSALIIAGCLIAPIYMD